VTAERGHTIIAPLRRIFRISAWLAATASLLVRSAIVTYDGVTARLPLQYRTVTFVVGAIFLGAGLLLGVLERGLACVYHYSESRAANGRLPPDVGRAWITVHGVLMPAMLLFGVGLGFAIVAAISRMAQGTPDFG